MARARASRACGRVAAATEGHGVLDPGGRIAALDVAGPRGGGLGARDVALLGQGAAAAQPAGEVAGLGLGRQARRGPEVPEVQDEPIA